MRSAAWPLALALVWMALVGEFTLANLLAGFAVAYLMLSVAGRTLGAPGYALRMPRLAGFLLYYAWEVLLSNLRVARDILRPRMKARPAIVAIPTRTLTATQLTVLANLVTMTPGTLSLDVADDGSTLYVHAMFGHDAEAVARDIHRGLERRIREVAA